MGGTLLVRDVGVVVVTESTGDGWATDRPPGLPCGFFELLSDNSFNDID